MSDRFCIVCRIFVVITGLWKSKTPANKACRGYLWRRRRDSNPRNPFGVYTISSRAPSTRLGDFSVSFQKMLNDCIIFTWLCQLERVFRDIIERFNHRPNGGMINESKIQG